jgi:hypothetical protein
MTGSLQYRATGYLEISGDSEYSIKIGNLFFSGRGLTRNCIGLCFLARYGGGILIMYKYQTK